MWVFNFFLKLLKIKLIFFPDLVIVVLSIIVTNGAALSDVCPTMGIYTVANNKSCTKYHLCVNGQTLQQECAHGLSFDRELGHCNLEAATRCNLDLCPVDTVGIVTMVGNPDDCSKYKIKSDKLSIFIFIFVFDLQILRMYSRSCNKNAMCRKFTVQSTKQGL